MLDKEWKLKKVHGGAVAIGDDYFKNDYKVILRQEINKGEKNEIAKFASKIVEDGDTIYIDAATTTEHIIDYLILNPKANRRDIANNIKEITEDGVKYHLKVLKEKGVINHIGPRFGGYWQVLVSI